MVDSTLVKADAALDSLKRVDGGPDETWHTKGKRYSNQTHQSSTDPDATLANKTGVHKALYYKVHSASDAKSRVVLDAFVTTGAPHDTVMFKYQMNRLLERVKVKEVTADRGYGSSENLFFLNEKKIKHYIPLWRPEVGQQEEGFKYDSKKDRFRCPEGKYLDRLNNKDVSKIYRASFKVCSQCPRFMTCLSDGDRKNSRGKRVRRHINQPLFNQILWREKTKLFRQKLHERMWKIEGIFAESKTFHGLGRARYRRMTKLQIQTYMVFSVLNLKRVLSVVELIMRLLQVCSVGTEKIYQKLRKYWENFGSMRSLAEIA